jgi:hypothetical protein
LRPSIAIKEIAEPGACAPVIPFEILSPRLEQFAFSHRFIQSLVLDQDVRNLQFRNQQNFYANRFALHERGFELSIE